MSPGGGVGGTRTNCTLSVIDHAYMKDTYHKFPPTGSLFMYKNTVTGINVVRLSAYTFYIIRTSVVAAKIPSGWIHSNDEQWEHSKSKMTFGVTVRATVGAPPHIKVLHSCSSAWFRITR